MTIALVTEPRFPGGTSTALAREIAAFSQVGNLRVVGLRSAMFSGDRINPLVQAALDRHRLALEWAEGPVAADVIILHNPSFLKRQKSLPVKLICRRLIVVTHENFSLEGGRETFDVAACLDAIDRATLCGSKVLAPVSLANRRSVAQWLNSHDSGWSLAGRDWINICDQPAIAPNPQPSDRRGRHSRPGMEKFPDLASMKRLFPASADYCGILGADSWVGPAVPRHWNLIPFNGMPVSQFLSQIDFFVYFTNRNWHESFGMAIAEAVSAGKLVVTDPETAATFGPGVLGVSVSDVDQAIARHIERPDLFAERVVAAQARIAEFSDARFREAANAVMA